MKAVLKLPAYRRLLAAYTLNELAWSIGSLALAVLVYRRTGSAFGAMAFFLCSQAVPALLSPLAVARLDQRAAGRVLPLLYALEAVLFAALAWLASRFALVPVLVLAALDGIVAATARALARAATVTVTSRAGLLREGNALINACFSVCFMAGPALGGLIVVAGGMSAALLANSGLFALITLTLATTGGLPGASPTPGPSTGRLRAAVSYARARRSVGVLLCLQAAAIAIFTISIPVEVVFAQHALHAGAAGYGVLLSAWGAGAVAGSAVYARWRGVRERSLIALGAGLLGVGFLVMAASPSLTVVAGAALGGVSNGVESIAVHTALQERVEQRWMALIMSLLESIKLAVPGIGILLGGAIAAVAGPRVALAVAGVGALGVMVAAWIVLRPVTVSAAAEREQPGVRPPACRDRETVQLKGPPRSPSRAPLTTVRRACIDIGSNTTRLLVAECSGGRLSEIHQQRAFTFIGRGMKRDGTIKPAKIDEVVEVVAGQLRRARELGAEDVRAVATAGIRRSVSGEALVAAIRNTCDLRVQVLSGAEEARLAFVGAARTLGHVPGGELGVVDVGGGSSELVVGTAPDRVSWCSSFAVGSGDLADGCLHSDPPAPAELSRARSEIERALDGLEVPRPVEAVAVGGSAASLHRVAGPLLDAQAFKRALRLLSSKCAAEVAREFALDIERVRLLPAALLILQAASERFGAALQIARGGLREGVLLEAGR